jgi:nitrogenase molybdenum-iron protein alpha/beta subunit
MAARSHLPLTPTFLDGLLMLVNAVPDIGMVIDCADCGEDKFAMMGMQHDVLSSLTHYRRGHRVRYSGLRATDMVMGTQSKVREAVRELADDRAPSMVLLVASSAAHLIGTDLEALAAELEVELGLPIGVVAGQTLSGDFTDGFGAGLRVVACKAKLAPGERRRRGVGVVGYLFERFEQDQHGNVRELRRMLAGLGCEPGSVWLDGGRVAELGAIADAETLIALPNGLSAARALAERLGSGVVEAALPIGLQGSARWLARLGEALGCPDRAGAFVARELDAVVPKLERAVRRCFIGRRAVVVASPHNAVGLTEYLAELGLVVTLLVVQTRRESEADAIAAALAHEGLTPRMLLDPTFPLVEQALAEAAGAGQVHVVVGSGAARDAAKASRIPYLEIAYPCYVRHALFDAPWIGFRGALWLADALHALLSDREFMDY